MSGNKITEDYLLISDGNGESGNWKPVLPENGSIYNDIENAIEKGFKKYGDRVWIKDFYSNQNCVNYSEVRKF